MKNINNYIVEKLKLDNDIKINTASNYKEVLNLIYECTLLDEDDDDLRDVLNNWIEDNNVNIIKIYILHTVDLYKHMHLLDKEIKPKIKVLSLGDYISLEQTYFPKSDRNKEKLNVYHYDDADNLDVYATDKALNIVNSKIDVVIERKATINENFI